MSLAAPALLHGHIRPAAVTAAANAAGSAGTATAIKISDVVDPVIVASARKHGHPRRRHIRAYRHPTRVLALDDLVTLIGASRTGQLLEIGVSHADGIDFIIHGMPARAKFIR